MIRCYNDPTVKGRVMRKPEILEEEANPCRLHYYLFWRR